MFGFFGFDPKAMTDDELHERETELHRKIVWAYKYTGGELADQIRSQLDAIAFERRERALMQVLPKRGGVIVETDPDLAAQAREEAENAEASVKAKTGIRNRPVFTPVERMKPTKRPTSKND